MNKVNFLLKTNFPFTNHTAAFLQEQTMLLQSLTALGGAKFVLSGCEEVDDVVSAGVIVIAGEILPFIGGAKLDKITIEEVRETATAFGVNYPDAYVNRHAKFDANGVLNWADFNRIVSNQTLWQTISEIKGDPPGIRVGWCGYLDKISDNYMLCDGRALNIADYPDLYTNIGNHFGSVGTTQFKLPDMREKFVVNYSGNGDYDAVGKTGGLEEVFLTKAQMPIHDHLSDPLFNRLSVRASDFTGQGTSLGQDAGNPTEEYRVGDMSDELWNRATLKSEGGGEAHENRPPFFVEAFIIKVKY